MLSTLLCCCPAAGHSTWSKSRPNIWTVGFSHDISAGLRLGGCPSAGSASTWPTGRRTLLVSKNLQMQSKNCSMVFESIAVHCTPQQTWEGSVEQRRGEAGCPSVIGWPAGSKGSTHRAIASASMVVCGRVQQLEWPALS